MRARRRHRRCELDVVIVGAGFAGLYMLHRVRHSGLRGQVYERGSGVGGTWFWNSYPGAQWRWSERFATQPEILSYLNDVADRLGLRDDIVLESDLVRAA